VILVAAVALAPSAAGAQTLYTFDLPFTPASADVTDRAALYDDAAAVVSVQGIVNRDAPELYLIHYVNPDTGGRNVDELWLERLADPAIGGDLVAGRPRIAIPDVATLVETFASALRGAAIWDPRVPATVNAAFTAAGAEDLVVIRYDTSPGSLWSRLVASGILPAVVSLVGPAGEQIFVDDGGSSLVPGTARPTSQSAKADAYVWAAETYLRTGRSNPREIGYYIDAWWIDHGGTSDLRHANVTNRDYLVAQRGFLLDLQPLDSFPPIDDPGQPPGTDVGVLREMLGAARERAGGDPIAVHGFISWQFKYVGPDGNAVASEWALVREISPYLAYLDADAPSPSGMANASFFMHLPVSTAPPPQPRPTPEDLIGAGHLEGGLIFNPSFEDNDSWWHLETTNRAVYADFSRAHSGRRFLECNTRTLDGDRETSLFQDGPAPPAGTRIVLRAFVRSPTGVPVNGELVIWALGGDTESAVTPFTAGAEWAEVRVALVPLRSHSTVRAQIYLRTIDVNLDIDDVAFYAGDARDAAPVAPNTYVLWYMGDYDAAAWMYNFTPSTWDGPGRGTVPLAWGFDPELGDRIAPFFRHALATRTARDFFVGGDSGPGYINPSFLSPDRLTAWGRFGNAMYRRLDESITGFLLNPTAPLPTSAVAAYDIFSADGAIVMAPSTEFRTPGLIGNMPVLAMTSDLARGDIGTSVERVRSTTRDASGSPEFRAYRMVLETGAFMTDLSARVDDALPGRRLRFVDPFTFMELLRRHHGGSNDYRASWFPPVDRLVATAGAPLDIPLRVRNDGWDTWTAAGATPYRIAAHVAASIAPRTLPFDPAAYPVRRDVPADVPPGGEVSITLPLTAPGPGDWVVQADVVRELVTWFETQGDLPLQLQLHVCDADRTACDGVCVNTTSNPAHCGGCGVACPEGSGCVAGRCDSETVEPAEPVDGGTEDADGPDAQDAPDTGMEDGDPDGDAPGSSSGCTCSAAGSSPRAQWLPILLALAAAP
jgi:hypothetical protein